MKIRGIIIFCFLLVSLFGCKNDDTDKSITEINIGQLKIESTIIDELKSTIDLSNGENLEYAMNTSHPNLYCELYERIEGQECIDMIRVDYLTMLGNVKNDQKSMLVYTNYNNNKFINKNIVYETAEDIVKVIQTSTGGYILYQQKIINENLNQGTLVYLDSHFIVNRTTELKDVIYYNEFSEDYRYTEKHRIKSLIEIDNITYIGLQLGGNFNSRDIIIMIKEDQ